MSVELLFDGYEEERAASRTASPMLETLASVREPNSTEDDMRRPHHCVVAWGTVMGGGDNKFQCVIESLSTKYTMFSRDGTPLRATVHGQAQGSRRVSMAAGGDSGGGGDT